MLDFPSLLPVQGGSRHLVAVCAAPNEQGLCPEGSVGCSWGVPKGQGEPGPSDAQKEL